MLFLSLAACEALGIQRARQIELVGEWDWMDGFTEFPKSCGAHATIVFDSNGKYYAWGYSGTWRLDGKSLIATITDIDPLHSEMSPEVIGKPHVSTISWIDPDTFVSRNDDNSYMQSRRCPDLE